MTNFKNTIEMKCRQPWKPGWSFLQCLFRELGGGGESTTIWCNLLERDVEFLFYGFVQKPLVPCSYPCGPPLISTRTQSSAVSFLLYVLPSHFYFLSEALKTSKGREAVNSPGSLQPVGNVSLNVLPPSGDPQNGPSPSSSHPDWLVSFPVVLPFLHFCSLGSCPI